MKDVPRVWPLKRRLYLGVGILAILFIWLTYKYSGAAGNNENLVLRLSLAFPELIIWCVAVLSAARFKDYAFSIKDTADGKALNLIANSLLALVFYVIFLSSANAFERLFLNSPDLRLAVTIGNYLPLGLAFISSLLVLRGSFILNKISRSAGWEPRRLAVVAIPLLLLLLVYAWQFYRAVPALPIVDSLPRFTQSAGVLLVTYVLPHIALWLMGLLACFNIAKFALTTKGTVYKQLFRNLSKGLILVFIGIFIAQLIVISPISLEKFNLWLGLAYLTMLGAILGFILIYKGAQQLDRIEQVTIKSKSVSSVFKKATT